MAQTKHAPGQADEIVVCIPMPLSLYTSIQHTAQAHGKTPGALIRYALAQWLHGQAATIPVAEQEDDNSSERNQAGHYYQLIILTEF